MKKKLQKKVIIISDLHIDRWTEERRILFRSFLDYVEENASEFYVLGDIFDFPAPAGKSIWPAHREFILRLRDMARRGVPTTYIIGNHDIGLRGIEIAEKGFTVAYVDSRHPLLGMFDCVSAHIEHGHDYDPLFRDHIYDAAGFIERVIGVEVDEAAADFWRDVLRIFRREPREHGRFSSDREPGVPPNLLKIWEKAAEQILKKRHCNLVIFGHTHAPCITPMVPGREYYVNTGDWLTHATYIEIHDERVALKDWALRKTLAKATIKNPS